MNNNMKKFNQQIKNKNFNDQFLKNIEQQLFIIK